MLKTTILSKMLIANEVLVANKICDNKGDDKLIKKCRKLFKSQKSAKSR